MIDPGPEITTRTLLIIDDNQSVRESLRFLLERRGYGALVAGNGPEGLGLATQHAIDGAMIDVNMPGMNGLAVCRVLRARMLETGRIFPIWMMTGARTPELTKAAIEAGALTLLAKPFDYLDLYQRFDEQFNAGTKPTAT